MIRAFKNNLPTVADSAYVDPAAVVIGQVTLGERVSIWPNATLRGDVNKIFIGDDSNIQDNAVVHVEHLLHECHVGERVTVGHAVVLHGCVIEDDSLIGIGAIVLNGAGGGGGGGGGGGVAGAGRDAGSAGVTRDGGAGETAAGCFGGGAGALP